MKKYLFSPPALAFYPAFMIEEYRAAGTLPIDVFEVDASIRDEMISGSHAGMTICVDENGHPYLEEAPAPSIQQIVAAKGATVMAHMDQKARALHYDNLASAITYAEEPAVPKFQKEGRAFREWRRLV